MSEEEQQQKPSYAYAATRDAYGPSSIVTLTDPTNDLYRFELSLRGMKEKNGEAEVVTDALMNDKGINSVMSAVCSVVHQMNTLSNFNEVDMKFMILGLADTVIKDLMLNRKTYGVSRKNRDLIVDNVVRFTYGFAKRAFEEGDKKFWKGSTHEITQHNPNKPQNKQFSVFRPSTWGK